MSKQLFAFSDITKDSVTLSGKINFFLLSNPSFLYIKKENKINETYVNEIKINKVFIDLFFFLKGYSIYFQFKNEINKTNGIR